ncbi:ribosome-associated protein YbcJ [Zobellella taiwanensis]|jgi:ribosome-associated protein|uniref:Ribosome-associated protein n=1 Tax=Zobellella taiwanensis TaxID=347535 RepID=A0A2P7QX67_9GAMM|nr:ribosome-associated protein YbcJ [Zobellella taiwanensis]PSJ42556.1 ribosome-associated protein [Zobellella taiwanensis]
MSEQFSLEGHPFIPLHNLLKVLGWCDTGAMAKMVIDDGQVRVNGEVEVRKRCKITAGQSVSFNGQDVVVTE